MSFSITQGVKFISAAAIILPAMQAQGLDLQKHINAINQSLIRSEVLSIDAQGEVRIDTPSNQLRFKIQDVAFGFNGLNDDARLRIGSHRPICIHENKNWKEDIYRESFGCHSRKAARRAIEAFREIQKHYTDRNDAFQLSNKKLTVNTLPYQQIGPAIHFINDQLTSSMICQIHPEGFLYINSPSNIYRVDLRKAEFGLNTSSSTPKIRIYGDFCLESLDEDTPKEYLPRESFEIYSTSNPKDIIKAFYFIKNEFSPMDIQKLDELPNLKDERIQNFNNIPKAIESINQRLSISIITEITPKGDVTLNASDKIYRFNLHDCHFEVKQERNPFKRSIMRMIQRWTDEDPFSSITLKSSNGLKACTNPHYFTYKDKIDLSCRNQDDAKAMIDALAFIKGALKP